MEKTFIIIMTIMLALTSTLSFAVDTDKDEAMIMDTLIGRPVGLVATVVGSVVFVVGLPFSLLGGNTSDTARSLVVNPARFTFVRPVGDIRPENNSY